VLQRGKQGPNGRLICARSPRLARPTHAQRERTNSLASSKPRCCTAKEPVDQPLLPGGETDVEKTGSDAEPTPLRSSSIMTGQADPVRARNVRSSSIMWAHVGVVRGCAQDRACSREGAFPNS